MARTSQTLFDTYITELYGLVQAADVGVEICLIATLVASGLVCSYNTQSASWLRLSLNWKSHNNLSLLLAAQSCIGIL